MSRALRSVAIVWDALATADAASAETGAAEAVAVASVTDVVADVAEVAASLGLRVDRAPLAGEPRAMLRQVAALDGDVVVNLAESWAGRARNEAGVGWLLELRGLAYTGATPRALGLCLDKPLARAVLAAAGVPVPEGVVIESPCSPAEIGPGRWIVKPAAQDASHGIDAGSVVEGEAAARERARHLVARGLGSALIERYVDGRELNVSIVELDGAPPRVLPIAEIDYARWPAGLPQILTFAAKWDVASPEYRGSTSVEAELLEPATRARVEAVALAAWRALGLRDYGRVDLRLDRRGEPFVIDVNPNPDLSRGAGLHLAADRGGLRYEQLIAGLLGGAMRRARED